MTNILTKPLGQVIRKNPIVEKYQKMWPFIKPYWFRASLGLVLAIPVGALDSAIALFMKYYTDDILVAKNTTFASYIPWLIIGFVLVQSIMTYAETYLNSWVGNKITLDVRRKLFKKLMTMSSSYFDTVDSGHVMMRYNNDADSACNGLINSIYDQINLLIILLYPVFDRDITLQFLCFIF